jgi:hypothetical protein
MQKHLIRVVYPTDDGRITFRTEENWDSNIEAHSPGRTGAYVNFRFKRNGHISISNQFCSMTASGAWSRGENFLAVTTSSTPLEIHSYFREDRAKKKNPDYLDSGWPADN